MSIDRGQRLTPRSPGQHARAIVLRLRMRTLLALGAVAILTTIAGRAFGWRSPLFMGSEVALLLVILAVYRYVLPLVDRHDRGATGEEQVGGLLESLPGSDWRVLHDVRIGRGNVDHIAIGPPGVFTVETKSHPGPIRVRGVHGALLRQAQAQRSLLEAVVDMPVEPLIVFSRAWVDKPLARRKGVRLLPARMMVRYLAARAARLSGEQVAMAHSQVLDAIVAAASGSGPGGECARRRRMPAGAMSRLMRGGTDRGTDEEAHGERARAERGAHGERARDHGSGRGRGAARRR